MNPAIPAALTIFLSAVVILFAVFVFVTLPRNDNTLSCHRMHGVMIKTSAGKRCIDLEAIEIHKEAKE